MVAKAYKHQLSLAKDRERKSWKKGAKISHNPKRHTQRSRTVAYLGAFDEASQ